MADSERTRSLRPRVRPDGPEPPAPFVAPPAEPVVSSTGKFFGVRTADAVFPMLIAHGNIFVYALAFWLQQPVLPFLSKQLGADAATYGALQSVFAAIQLLGGPLVGRLCDVAGVRAALVVSQSASAASYLALALAGSVPMLLVSKLPSLLMHAMMAAQATIAGLSSESDRARALGRLSLTYGLGMVLGSSLGGLLSRSIGYANVALVSAVLTALTVPVTMAAMPPVVRSAGSPASVLSLGVFLRLFGFDGSAAGSDSPRRLRSVFFFATVMGSGLAMQQATFSLVAMERFGLEASQLGFVMSFVAALGVTFNMALVGPLVRTFGERGTCVLAAALAAAAFCAYSLTTSIQGVLAVMVPMSLATSSMYSVVTSAVSKTVPAADLGSAIGLRHGVSSVLGVAAPSIAGIIMTRSGFPTLALSCAATSALAAVVALNSRWAD
eukprot:a848221_16.p1 GENE.a848221_16~~a848221_16.p1  ORF type:complete len:449 (-),score=154.55 a848221_16:41-1360(-)